MGTACCAARDNGNPVVVGGADNDGMSAGQKLDVLKQSQGGSSRSRAKGDRVKATEGADDEPMEF